jgi:hypothetical protein
MIGYSEYCQIIIDLSSEHVLSKMSYTLEKIPIGDNTLFVG